MHECLPVVDKWTILRIAHLPTTSTTTTGRLSPYVYHLILADSWS